VHATVAPLSLPDPGWAWSIFWLVCPILVLALLLGLVVLTALFRAPRSEATQVLTIFTSAFVRLADRLPTQARSGSQGLDTGSQTREHQEGEPREAELP
jgi:hypothetical protein